jgi:hypothetical protein
MNVPSDVIGQSHPESQVASSEGIPLTQRIYWSLRRELWENRSIYIAPIAVAALIPVGFLISMTLLPDRMPAVVGFKPLQQHVPFEQQISFAALLIMLTTFLVAVFYCLDALQSERRDRSILFWKSLPVSDLMTVLSKASIPLLVIPHLRDHHCNSMGDAAAEHCSPCGKGPECRGSMESSAVMADVADAALSPAGHSWALVRAHLGLAPAGLQLGAPRGISVGCLAAPRHRGRGKNCIQHLALRRPDGVPL